MQIRQGAMMVYYCYDVADSIRLDEVEMILGKKPQVSKLTSERIPSYVQYRVAPLLVRIGERAFEAGGTKLESTVEAKLYDFGVVTIRFWIPISGTLEKVSLLASKLAFSRNLESIARDQLKKILSEITGAMTNAHKPAFWEDYIIATVNRFDHAISGKELLKREGSKIAAILCCESGKLSDRKMADVLRSPLSYYEDELVLIDWNAAFVYNPRISYDVADVIEFALISSLELRMYDSLLDKALDRAYDDIAAAEKKAFSLSPFSQTIKFLTETKLEVSDMIDNVEHALKIVGELYLAKVYETASERFWLDGWKSSVRDKLATIESTYKMLHDRTSTRLLLILEFLIVVLFVLDLIVLVIGA